MNPSKLTAVARGDIPADVCLSNGRIINTFTGEIASGNVAIAGDLIAGVGDYNEAFRIIDLGGRYLAPGFIDGHVHLESSLLSPPEYARAVVPRGVLGVVTDFHEIANVCGLEGIRYVMQNAEKLPMDVFGMVPSCVPATDLETSGARLEGTDLESIRDMRNNLGLGEVMNFPAVISGDPAAWKKLEMFEGRVIDGHSPGLGGRRLNAYLAAGVHSDHQCIDREEAREKLRLGMHIMIREGSSEQNLEALLPLVTDKTYPRCMFVTDERDCLDLLRDGAIDAVVRKAIRCSLDPVRAIQMATINTAGYFRLNRLGGIAPGYEANLIVLNDLENLRAEKVFYRGRLVAEDGVMVADTAGVKDARLHRTVNIRAFDVAALKMPTAAEVFPVIEMIPGQIVTRRVDEQVKVDRGYIEPDIERDILKVVVVERHHGSGNIGRGLLRGLGLKRGAVASSIAHDSHNIVAAGTNDADLYVAIKEVERLQGGIVVVAGGEVAGCLPLPVAGLLSEEPLTVVVEKLKVLTRLIKSYGCSLDAPFVALSFVALPVIPELRLTDRGLVDVREFRLL